MTSALSSTAYSAKDPTKSISKARHTNTRAGLLPQLSTTSTNYNSYKSYRASNSKDKDFNSYLNPVPTIALDTSPPESARQLFKPPPPLLLKCTHQTIELDWAAALEAASRSQLEGDGRLRVVLQECSRSGLSRPTIHNAFSARSSESARATANRTTHMAMAWTPGSPEDTPVKHAKHMASAMAKSVTFAGMSHASADIADQEWGIIYTGYATRYIVENVEPERSYAYRICFKNNGSSSEWSLPLSVNTLKPPQTGEDLHRCIRMCDALALRKTLAARQAKVEATDPLGLTPLMSAAQKGLVEHMEMLLLYMADVNATNQTGKTALMYAAYAGHLDAVRFLIEHGALPDLKDKSGSTSLHYACDGQQFDVIEYLLEFTQIDVNQRDTGIEWTPLMRVAATHGSSEVASRLIKAGAMVDSRDREGKTPLMAAALNGHADLVELLLRSGADITLKNEFGKSSYEFAQSMDRKRVLLIIQQFAAKRGISL